MLGEFDLDPASSAAAQRQVQATEFFDKNDDGLTRPWRGRVWAESALLAARYRGVCEQAGG